MFPFDPFTARSSRKKRTIGRGRSVSQVCYYQTVGSLIQMCPLAGTRLLTRVPGSFQDCLVLDGVVPTTRVHHDRLGDPEGSHLFIQGSDDAPYYLPPLMAFDMDTNKCLFANDAFRLATRRMEFIDYFTGQVHYRKVSPYAVDPVPARQAGRINAFDHLSSVEEPCFEQRHRASGCRAVGTVPSVPCGKSRYVAFPGRG